MRLTFITSLLLTSLCIAFTLFSIYNVKAFIINGMAGNGFEIYSKGSSLLPALPQNEAQSLQSSYAIDISTFSYTSFWFMAVAILIGSGLMYFISGMILKPLGRLSNTIASIDKNALCLRITEFKSGDELNTLANSFNEMLEKLEDGYVSCVLKQEKDGCKITVEDNGSGVKLDDIPHIFEPFYRGDKYMFGVCRDWIRK